MSFAKSISQYSVINYTAAPSRSHVIINADDFGITQGVNRAIAELAHAERITSTSVMTNMPLYSEISGLKYTIGIGVHFNLTTGIPVSDRGAVPSLVNEEGGFHDLATLLGKMRRGQIDRKEVRYELRAQIQRMFDLAIRPDHINSHSSFMKYPFFMSIAREIASAFKIPAVRTFTPRRFDRTRLRSPQKIAISLYLEYQKMQWKQCGFHVSDRKDSLLQQNLTYTSAMTYLEEVFTALPKGILEFVVHPGYCDDDSSFLGSYRKEREIELHALQSTAFGQLVMRSGAKRITFSDMSFNSI